MKKDLFRVSTLCAALFTAQFATAAVSSDEDSVKSWGAWASLATAAGGGAGQTLRLNLQFSDTNNMTDAGKFVTDVDVPDETVAYGAIGDKSGRFRRTHNRYRVSGWMNGRDNFQANNRQLSSFESVITFAQEGAETKFPATGTFTLTDEFNDSFTSDELGFFERDKIYGGWLESTHSSTKVLILDTAVEGLNVGIAKFGRGWDRSMATFVGGTPSSLGAIQALGNNVTAHYHGAFLRSVNGSEVNLNVNLSNATWSGSFSSTRVNFGVEGGSINGSKLTAGTANLTGMAQSGSINANFFGSKAEAIAGIADVELGKGCDGECGSTRRFVDTFVTVKSEGDGAI